MAEKKKNRYGVWFIVILLLVGLAGFGTGGLSGNVRSIGTVGEKEISVTEYSDQINRVSAQFGVPISFRQAVDLQLDQEALRQLIRNKSLDNEATQLGLSAGDENVLARLQQFQEFQGGNGFNPETYRFTLERIGQNEADFENGLREDLSRELLQSAIVGGVPAGDAYANALVQYIGEQRSITWATIDDTALTAPVPGATQADQQTYYDANPDAFTRPETRDITYVWLTPTMIQDQMNVSDDEIQKLYNDRIIEFVQPERRLVERLVYISLTQAEEARTRLDAGDVAFEDLVVERGLSLADIDLGDVDRPALGTAGDAVFAAGPGDVVGPFNSSLGPALFRMNAILSAQETTLQEATPALREELAADAARDVINDSTDQIIDLLAGGASMEDLAERTDMELGTINWTADVADGIAAYDAFRQAAASVEQGAFAEVTDLADGGIFALRLDGITPPTLQPLNDVRDAVNAAWQIEARQSAVMIKAAEFAATIQPLTGFDTVGLEPTVDENLTRRSFVEGTPPDFNDQMFEMTLGEVRVLDAETRAIIIRLDGVAPPDPTSETTLAQSEQLAQSAAAGIAQDIFEAYATTVQERTDVNINQVTVNAVNAQFQ